MSERNDPCPCGSGIKFKNCCLNVPVTKHTKDFGNGYVATWSLPIKLKHAKNPNHVACEWTKVPKHANAISMKAYEKWRNEIFADWHKRLGLPEGSGAVIDFTQDGPRINRI